MLGLAKGMMPGRQVAQDKKSARRKNQNNEGTLPWANAAAGSESAVTAVRAMLVLRLGTTA